MISKLSCYMPFPKNANLIKEKENVGKYFNYKTYVSMKKVCENLKNINDEPVFNALDIFSKNHYQHRDTLYYNLQTLNVEKAYIKGTTGGYTLGKDYNDLYYSEENAVYHEILHVASSSYNEKEGILYSGLGQYDLKNNINFGEGITEGYVELLCDRDLNDDKFISWFDDENGKYKIEYCYVKAIVRQLEVILGREFLEECFFNSDCKKLIDELCKYSDEKEVMKFFHNCDVAAIAANYNNIILNKKTLEAQEFLFDIANTYFKDKLFILTFDKLIRFKNYLQTPRIVSELRKHKEGRNK